MLLSRCSAILFDEFKCRTPYPTNFRSVVFRWKRFLKSRTAIKLEYQFVVLNFLGHPHGCPSFFPCPRLNGGFIATAAHTEQASKDIVCGFTELPVFGNGIPNLIADFD